MAAENIGEPPETFVQQMKPLLTLVPESELASLMQCLYAAAKKKLELEENRRWAGEMAKHFRKMRRSMKTAQKLLGRALRILERTEEKEGQNLRQMEWQEESYKFNFDETIQNLKRAWEAAGASQPFLAAAVHPHLRDKAEKEMAKQLMAPGVDAHSMEFLISPARPKSPDIEHWFIGAAADCLDKYRTGTGEKIPRHDQIISALFKIAFGDHSRSEENIRKELVRQEKSGRPSYLVPEEAIPGAIAAKPLGQKPAE